MPTSPCKEERKKEEVPKAVDARHFDNRKNLAASSYSQTTRTAAASYLRQRLKALDAYELSSWTRRWGRRWCKKARTAVHRRRTRTANHCASWSRSNPTQYTTTMHNQSL